MIKGHKLSITPKDSGQEIRLDDFLLKGVTGYELKSRIEPFSRHIELNIKLKIPMSNMSYAPFFEKNSEMAALVTPSASAETTERE